MHAFCTYYQLTQENQTTVLSPGGGGNEAPPQTPAEEHPQWGHGARCENEILFKYILKRVFETLNTGGKSPEQKLHVQ